jgi:hypothetical protein
MGLSLASVRCGVLSKIVGENGKLRIATDESQPGEAGTKKLDNDFFDGLFRIFRVRD